jgi:hypothetical protein
MAEGQTGNKRKIGTGMKPRGKQRVKPQKEKNQMTEQSTVEGHETPSKEAVLEGQEGNSKGGTLEPENGEKSLQNLENSEAMVADNKGLEKALNESASGEEEVIDAEFREVDEPEPPCEGKPMGEELAGVTVDRKYAIGVDFGEGRDKGVIAVIKTGEGGKPDELMGTFAAIAIGPQPDGSEKFIITIAEGYTDAVRQWAESDGVPVEQWLSDRLYEYISTYGEPAKGR